MPGSSPPIRRRPPRALGRPTGAFAGGRLDLGSDGLGGHGAFRLDGRQAQDVGDHEAAVHDRPGHLARGRRMTAAQDIAKMKHVIKRQELIKADLAAIQVSHALQAILLDRADHRLAVVARG